ncbi:MAG: hypothetical protein AAFS11_04170 [Planctomycetota bacterium]
MKRHLIRIDRRIEHFLYVFGHTTHGVTLGLVFIWFGSLKVVGQETATSIIGKTIYLGSPEIMVPLLGGWEIAIGLCMFFHSLHRVAFVLLAIRMPGTVLALVLKPEACFVVFPYIPTIAGQYIIKDLMLLSAAAVMGGYVSQKPHRLRKAVKHIKTARHADA